MDCGGSKNSAVSHSDSDEKSSILLQWRAPSGPMSGRSNTVYFKFTVVQDGLTYWVGIPSAFIKVRQWICY